LKRFPQNARLLELLARLQASVGKHREALAAVEQLRGIPGHAVVADLIAGITNYSTKNYRDCAANLKAALDADPELKSQSADFPAIDRLTALRFLAEALLLTDKPADAGPYAKEAFAISGVADDAWTVATSFRETGDMEGQKKWLAEALKKDPSYVRALVELASMAIAARNLGEAEDYLQRALARAPEDRQAKHLMETVRRQAGKSTANSNGNKGGS
jgi:tetratricopeptide (TPR) repeat protein